MSAILGVLVPIAGLFVVLENLHLKRRLKRTEDTLSAMSLKNEWLQAVIRMRDKRIATLSARRRQ